MQRGNTPCIGPYNTSYLRHVMFSYVVYSRIYNTVLQRRLAVTRSQMVRALCLQLSLG